MEGNFGAPMLSRHDSRGVFLHASAGARALLGQPPAALVGTTLQSLVSAEDVPRVDEAFARLVGSEEPVVLRCRLRADGEPVVEVIAHAAGPEIHCVIRGAPAAEPGAADRERMRRLETLLGNVPGIVWASWGLDTEKERATYINDNVLALTGYTREEWQSRPLLWLEIVHPDDQASAREGTARLMANGQETQYYRWIRKDGAIVWIEARTRVLRDADGKMTGLCGVNMDITAQKEAEAAESRLREEIIQTQQRILAELSTPMIPLGDQVVVMPLIGTLDRARADRVVEALLHGVSSAAARVVIVDITGVPSVDTQIAQTLLRAARGVRLLGAEVVLTGIRPEVAQTLVSLGTDLGHIVTLGNLEAGIRHAKQRRS